MTPVHNRGTDQQGHTHNPRTEQPSAPDDTAPDQRRPVDTPPHTGPRPSHHQEHHHQRPADKIPNDEFVGRHVQLAVTGPHGVPVTGEVTVDFFGIDGSSATITPRAPESILKRGTGQVLGGLDHEFASIPARGEVRVHFTDSSGQQHTGLGRYDASSGRGLHLDIRYTTQPVTRGASRTGTDTSATATGVTVGGSVGRENIAGGSGQLRFDDTDTTSMAFTTSGSRTRDVPAHGLTITATAVP